MPPAEDLSAPASCDNANKSAPVDIIETESSPIFQTRAMILPGNVL